MMLTFLATGFLFAARRDGALFGVFDGHGGEQVARFAVWQPQDVIGKIEILLEFQGFEVICPNAIGTVIVCSEKTNSSRGDVCPKCLQKSKGGTSQRLFTRLGRTQKVVQNGRFPVSKVWSKIEGP